MTPWSTAVPTPPLLPNQAPSSSTQTRHHLAVVHAADTGPTVTVGEPSSKGQSGQPIELDRPQRRLRVRAAAVEEAAPAQRDRRGAPPGAEQRAGDRADRVGVAACPCCGTECGGEVVARQDVLAGRRRGDRGERCLERADDPAVDPAEPQRRGTAGGVDPRRPFGMAVGIDVVEAAAHRGTPVEGLSWSCGGDGVLDGERPEHTGVDAVGVRVGQASDAGGEASDGIAVAERGEGDRPGAHRARRCRRRRGCAAGSGLRRRPAARRGGRRRRARRGSGCRRRPDGSRTSRSCRRRWHRGRRRRRRARRAR